MTHPSHATLGCDQPDPTRRGWVCLAPMLRRRASCLLVPLLFVAYGAIDAAGLGFWRCPLDASLGVPCPGCGMTRAMHAGLHGEYARTVELNPFAPAFAALFVGLLIAGLLPQHPRLRLAEWSEWVERRFPFALLFGIVFILWGSVRAGCVLVL